MNKYKEMVRIRINSLSLVAAGTALIYIGLLFYRDHLPVLPSFIKGFHIGVFIGIELVAVAWLGKYLKVRKDENALKKMYVEENDERSSLIIHKASLVGMIFIFGGLATAAVIAGFFHTIVFVTLTSALIFTLLVFYALWIYFSKKL